MRYITRGLVGLGVLAFAACDRSTTAPRPQVTPPPATPPPATLSIRDTTLLVDETLVLPVVGRDGQGLAIDRSLVTWQLSDSSIMAIDGNGRVTALTLGTAVVTATMGAIDARATITIAPQFTHVAPGATHACGITGRAEVYCWGMSVYGEIGPVPSGLEDCSQRFGPGVRCSPFPVRSSNLRLVAITAGDMHTCALDTQGTAFCWGANFYGQSGTGSGSAVPTPTAVAGGHRFIQIVAGRMHTCGITTEHDAYCWGWDRAGTIGAGDVSSSRCVFFGDDPCARTPRAVAGGHAWMQLTASDDATCGLTTDGDLYCWGLEVGGSDGLYCQVPGNLEGCTHVPVRVSPGERYRATGIGDVHRCQQLLDGTLQCWGANYWGMFGNGTTTRSATSVTAGGGAVYASLAVMRESTCALSDDGRARCWGFGGDGQIGNGDIRNAVGPIEVIGGHRFGALASSGNSDAICGIAVTGRAYCWGSGTFGQLGNGEFLSSSRPVLVQLVRSQSP